MAVGPVHHRGDGEAAGEWGGCGGDRGHWRFWIGWGWEVGEFIRIKCLVGVRGASQRIRILKPGGLRGDGQLNHFRWLGEPIF